LTTNSKNWGKGRRVDRIKKKKKREVNWSRGRVTGGNLLRAWHAGGVIICIFKERDARERGVRGKGGRQKEGKKRGREMTRTCNRIQLLHKLYYWGWGTDIGKGKD